MCCRCYYTLLEKRGGSKRYGTRYVELIHYTLLEKRGGSKLDPDDPDDYTLLEKRGGSKLGFDVVRHSANYTLLEKRGGSKQGLLLVFHCRNYTLLEKRGDQNWMLAISGSSGIILCWKNGEIKTCTYKTVPCKKIYTAEKGEYQSCLTRFVFVR